MGFGEFLASSGLGFWTAFLLSMVLLSLIFFLLVYVLLWTMLLRVVRCFSALVVAMLVLHLISCTIIYLHVPTAFKDESML